MTNPADSDPTDAGRGPLRLLLVDDHVIMRIGLANMLSARAEFVVAAEADDGVTAIELHREHQPDVTLLDVMMPSMSGLECLTAIRRDCPDARVLMLSSSQLDHDVHEAVRLGANGYITKNARPTELIAAIEAVGRGERVIDAELTEVLRRHERMSELTPRELQVLKLLRSGNSNSEIGINLGITARTAKAHVAAIMLKLEAHDRTGAVSRGFELGLLRV